VFDIQVSNARVPGSIPADEEDIGRNGVEELHLILFG